MKNNNSRHTNDGNIFAHFSVYMCYLSSNVASRQLTSLDNNRSDVVQIYFSHISIASAKCYDVDDVSCYFLLWDRKRHESV